MKKSKLLQKTINKLIDASFKDGKIVEHHVTRSIKALKSLPRHEAIWTLSEYVRQLRRKERQHTMYIETVIPLPIKTLQRMKKVIDKKIKIIKVMTAVNKEILGGFKLRVGDEVWDQSLLAKLNQVKEVISTV